MGKVTYRKISEAMENLAVPLGSSGRTSVSKDSDIKEYFLVSLDNLRPYKNQARQIFDDESLKSLAESIKNYGVRQPLSVLRCKGEDGKFEIVSGERRARAAKLAGISKVPCIILNDFDNANVVALLENIHRKDLHPVELARAYRYLIDSGEFKNSYDFWTTIGVDKSSAYETLKLLELPEEVLDELLKHNIRQQMQLRMLLKSPNPIELLHRIIQGGRNDGVAKSVMRVSLKDGDFTIQKNALTKLSPTEREKLKGLLLQLLETL